MILPLSAAKIGKYIECERFFVDRYIRKIVETKPNDAAQEGIDKHLFFEQVLKGEPVTKEYSDLREYAEWAKSLVGVKHVEVGICVDSNLKECDWWHKDAFVRGKTDLLIETETELRILDWKFTKRSGIEEAKKYRLEMDVFAFLAFIKFPLYDRIVSELHWLGESKSEPTIWEYKREKDFDRVHRLLYGYYRSMKANIVSNDWPVRQSGLCKGWCANTGCPVWEPKKER